MRVTINPVTVGEFVIDGYATVDIPDYRYLALQLQFELLEAENVLSFPQKTELQIQINVDRGVVNAYDFTQDTLTLDGGTYQMDLRENKNESN